MVPTVSSQQFYFSWKNNKDGATNGNVINLIQAKKELLKKGYANQSDANYFSMRLLEDFPIIAESLAKKFKWLIIDEAQDTSDIQMRIIDLIIAAGIENVMLVGDPDQAIFEWNDAKPELFIGKYEQWITNSIVLSESWRSSQLICDTVHKLSSLDKTSRIIAKNSLVKDVNLSPEIWIYDEKNIPTTIEAFITKCKEVGIEIKKENIAVVAKSKDFFELKFDGNKASPWIANKNYTRDFALAKYLFDKTEVVNAFKCLERGYIKALRNDASFISEKEIDEFVEIKGLASFRKNLYKLLIILPHTNMKLGEWVNTANKSLTDKGYNISLSIDSQGKEYTFKQAFPYEYFDILDKEYVQNTIHKVKGETYEAILVFIKGKAGSIAIKDLLEIIDGKPKKYKESTISKAREDYRVIYVAISRPRKLLVIAVPNRENLELWNKRI